MTKHTFLLVLVVSIVALVVGVFMPSSIDEKQVVGYPWQVTIQEDGSISIFQINLNKTTLGEAEQLLKEEAELTLFKPEKGDAVIEAYMNEVNIGGLKSKMVFTFDMEQQQVEAMFERGVRISTLGSGTRRVTLNSDDQVIMRSARINNLTYIPAINLTEELITKRFGKPENKIKEEKSGAVHWLYPNKGVDIAVNEDAKEVIQYVNPNEFKKVTEPLSKSNRD